MNKRGDFTGFEFGRRKGGTFCGRFYDKTRQIATSGADYWPGIWGDSYVEGLPVHRTEFEIGRAGLRELRIDDPLAAVESAGSVWRYCTTNWLTYRTPGRDKTRSRWDIAPEWLQVQEAKLAHGAHGIQRTLAGKNRGDLRKLGPAMVGCLTSFAALTGASGLDEALCKLPEFVSKYERQKGFRFEDRTAEKSRKWLL